ISGVGRYAADIALPNTLHVALVACPYPFARILSIDTSAALAVPGVKAVITGDDMVQATAPMMTNLDLPNVKRYPLAHKLPRYPREGVAGFAAESRPIAEDAAELVNVEYEPLEPITDPEAALANPNHAVHPDNGSNVLYRRKFVWGPVEQESAAADHRLSF